MINNRSNAVFSNFLWRFLERCGAQSVTFIVSIILARILEPTVYGIVALVTVFTNILGVFIDSGMGNALIQKKDADDIDFSSVFYFNIIMCSVLYFLMFIAAPFMAAFYNMPELTAIVRVLSLSLVISGVKNIQVSYISKNMLFKRFFFSTLGGTIGAAIIGIIMALNGFGVWALVTQSLFNSIIDTIILWVTVKWRPKKIFSLNRLKALFSYGWNLLVSALLDTLYNNIYSLIIAKKYLPEDLAVYNKGGNFPRIIVSNINSSINSVLLPTMSKVQDDTSIIKNMTKRAIKTSTYIMMPLMVGLAVCSKSFISLILTEKWLPCIPFLRIFCFTYAFWPIHTANLNAIKAMGRSDLFLILEIIKKIVGIIALISTMWISVMAMAYSLIFTSVISQIINAWPNKKLMNYSYLEQIKDILPQIGLSIIMGAVVYCIQFIGLNDILTLLIQIPIGIIIYIVESKLFNIDSFEYLLGIINGVVHKKMHKDENNKYRNFSI